MAKLDKLAFNNVIVGLRGAGKQAIVYTIHKLRRESLHFTNKKVNDAKEKMRNERRAKRYIEEINVLKSMDLDDIMKFSALNTRPFREVGNDPNSPLELRALVRISEHKKIQPTIMEFRRTYPNWQNEVMNIIKSLGVNCRKKRLKRLAEKDKLRDTLEKERKFLVILHNYCGLDIDHKMLTKPKKNVVCEGDLNTLLSLKKKSKGKEEEEFNSDRAEYKGSNKILDNSCEELLKTINSMDSRIVPDDCAKSTTEAQHLTALLKRQPIDSNVKLKRDAGNMKLMVDSPDVVKATTKNKNISKKFKTQSINSNRKKFNEIDTRLKICAQTDSNEVRKTLETPVVDIFSHGISEVKQYDLVKVKQLGLTNINEASLLNIQDRTFEDEDEEDDRSNVKGNRTSFFFGRCSDEEPNLDEDDSLRDMASKKESLKVDSTKFFKRNLFRKDPAGEMASFTRRGHKEGRGRGIHFGRKKEHDRRPISTEDKIKSKSRKGPPVKSLEGRKSSEYDSLSLHPSWEAKRKFQASAAIGAFHGKKTVFD